MEKDSVIIINNKMGTCCSREVVSAKPNSVVLTDEKVRPAKRSTKRGTGIGSSAGTQLGGTEEDKVIPKDLDIVTDKIFTASMFSAGVVAEIPIPFKSNDIVNLEPEQLKALLDEVTRNAPTKFLARAVKS